MDLTRKIVWSAERCKPEIRFAFYAAFDALVWGVLVTENANQHVGLHLSTFGWGAIAECSFTPKRERNFIVAGLAAALTLYVGGWCCEGIIHDGAEIL